SPYLQGLRDTLRPAVQLLWTGTRVRAAQWRPADAQAYGALIGRTPIVWDNWTNDDGSGNGRDGGTVRLFLGPYTRPASVTSAGARAKLARLPWPAFYAQALPFLDAASQAAGASAAAADLLVAERPSVSVVRTARGGFVVRAAPPSESAVEAARADYAHQRYVA